MKIDLDKIEYNGSSSGRIIVSDVRFSIEPNTIYTILGKNGSGKSTLLKAVTNLLHANYKITGKIVFGGSDILALTNSELNQLRKEKIKYVFQDASRSFDPLKKLQYYFEINGEKDEIGSLLEYFLLPPYSEISKLYPYEISGGMAQRLSLILALSSHPAVLILDEPTSGIDSAIANLFLLKIKEFAALKSNRVLLVTQDILFAEKVSTKIAILSNGTLSDFMEPDEIFNQNGAEKIFGSRV